MYIHKECVLTRSVYEPGYLLSKLPCKSFKQCIHMYAVQNVSCTSSSPCRGIAEDDPQD